MTEMDVALSDYVIAVFCVGFAVTLMRTKAANPVMQTWLVVMFFGIASAAVLGGTVHGFFVDPQSTEHTILWPMTMIAIGVSTLGAWASGASLLLSSRGVRLISVMAGIGFVVYCAVVLFVSQAYLIAILNYVPSAIFLLAAFGWIAWKERVRPALYSCVGLMLTFVAAGIQQAGISIHPVYMTHNTLYHVVQLAGLLLFFMGGRWALNRAKLVPASSK